MDPPLYLSYSNYKGYLDLVNDDRQDWETYAAVDKGEKISYYFKNNRQRPYRDAKTPIQSLKRTTANVFGIAEAKAETTAANIRTSRRALCEHALKLIANTNPTSSHDCTETNEVLMVLLNNLRKAAKIGLKNLAECYEERPEIQKIIGEEKEALSQTITTIEQSLKQFQRDTNPAEDPLISTFVFIGGKEIVKEVEEEANKEKPPTQKAKRKEPEPIPFERPDAKVSKRLYLLISGHLDPYLKGEIAEEEPGRPALSSAIEPMVRSIFIQSSDSRIQEQIRLARHYAYHIYLEIALEGIYANRARVHHFVPIEIGDPDFKDLLKAMHEALKRDFPELKVTRRQVQRDLGALLDMINSSREAEPPSVAEAKEKVRVQEQTQAMTQSESKRRGNLSQAEIDDIRRRAGLDKP